MKLFSLLRESLAKHDAVWVCVTQTKGSVPRDAGTWMAVFADHLVGTIGGGHLEHQAVALARQVLEGTAACPSEQTVPLGPSLGQCCGGVVQLSYQRISQADLAALTPRLIPVREPVALFGGGHVGRALVQVLSPLPFALRWIDSRDEVFPSDRKSTRLNSSHT